MNQVKICGNTACQAQNSVTSKFCSKCGYKFNAEQPYQTFYEQSHYPPASGSTADDLVNRVKTFVTPKYPEILQKGKNLIQKINVSKKTMIVSTISIAVLAIIVILLAVVLDNKSTVLKHAEKSVETGEVSDIMQIMSVDDYSPSMVQAFEKLLAEEDLVTLANDIQWTIDYMDEYEREEEYIILPSGNAQLLVSKTKKLKLFSHYEVTPLSIEMYAGTNFEGVQIEVGGSTEEISMDSEVWTKEVLPGEYTYDVLWDSPMGKFKEERTFIASLNGYNEIDAHISTYEVLLYSSAYPTMQFFIDDKEVDLSSMLYDSTLTVPTGLEFDLKASFDEDGVEYKSNELHVHEFVEEELVFIEYDELHSAEVMSDIDPYRDEIIETNIRLLIQRYLTIYTNEELDRLSEVISTSASFFESQMKNLQNLMAKGTDVEIENFQIVNIKELGEQQFEVTIDENYKVKNSEEDFKSLPQTSIYTIEVMDDMYYIVDFDLK